MPWLSQAGAFGEASAAAAGGCRGDGTPEGEVSGGGCALFSSALRHIRHLHAANSESRVELGCRRTSRRKREDSTGERGCKGEKTVGCTQRPMRSSPTKRGKAHNGSVPCRTWFPLMPNEQ